LGCWLLAVGYQIWKRRAANEAVIVIRSGGSVEETWPDAITLEEIMPFKI